ncbi:MAG: hypothetical protein ACFB50_14675 [Rubrobacteraceae bacterium]
MARPPHASRLFKREDPPGYGPRPNPNPKAGTGHGADPEHLAPYFAVACREGSGVSDWERCYELRLLQMFCEEYSIRLDLGATELQDRAVRAYETCREIESLSPGEEREVYLALYREAVLPGVDLIQEGEWERAFELLETAREKTERRFLGASRNSDVGRLPE